MGFGGFPLNPELASKVDMYGLQLRHSLSIQIHCIGACSLCKSSSEICVCFTNFYQTSFFLTVLADLDAVLFFEWFGVKDFLPNSINFCCCHSTHRLVDSISWWNVVQTSTLCVCGHNLLIMWLGYNQS